jgi:hypothetical protein
VGIAGRPRGAAHHGQSRGRRRSGVPLDEPGDTKRIVRNKRKSIKAVKKLTITTSASASVAPLGLVAGPAPVAAACH